MKILTNVSRFLLGFIFLVFGLNGFLHFIPMPPPSGVAGQFLGSMFALTILGPIIVNILLFHGLMNHDGLGLALFVTIPWTVVFASVRLAFVGIFQARVDIKATPEHRHSQAVSPA